MPQPERADRELLDELVRNGDEGCFRTLYRRHTPALYRIALRLTDDRDGSAEELVHDSWISASERWTGFKWQSSLRTWLTGILLNHIRNARRKWRNRPVDPLADELPAPVPMLDERLDLGSAIKALPEGYRAVLVMHDIEGYTHEEIAGLLEIEVGTSKSQLSRSRKALRHWLEPREGAR